jgi:membrane-associated phospholipid phosphatase
MLRYRKFLFLVMVALVPVTSANAGVLEGLASPVTTPASTWLLAGTGVTLAVLLFKDDIEDPAQKEAVRGHLLGKYSKVGDYNGRLIPNIAYAGGMFIASALGNETAAEKAKIMFLATLYSGVTSSILKVTVREPRPNDGTDRKSFPSGHATSAFAFAAVVGAEEGWSWGIPAYAMAVVTGYSRMSDNKHNLHDVTAGATIGVAYGLGIHFLRQGNSKASAVTVLPIWEHQQKGLELAYRF